MMLKIDIGGGSNLIYVSIFEEKSQNVTLSSYEQPKYHVYNTEKILLSW